ncbi:hypothetical protein ACET3Z_030016 [Daucus carota]
MEFNYTEESSVAAAESSNSNHGWQKVTYAKKQRKAPARKSESGENGSAVHSNDGVFNSLEKKSEERRRRIEAERAAAMEEDRPVKSGRERSEGDESDDEIGGGVVENGGVVEEKKEKKKKKEKKVKVTIAEAASRIDADDLAAFLADVSVSYEAKEDIQLMRFADYFGRAFAAVSANQFPWTKMFRESAIAKIADIPVSHIPKAVYKTSVEWINQRSIEALSSFVLWSLDSVLSEFASQQTGGKGSKKATQQMSSKSQVAIFSVLSMVLRRKPDVMINLLPNLEENSKFKGQDKLPLLAWIVAQACQGDLAVALYAWAHLILPTIGGKSGSNPQNRDLVLQLVERILSAPKARTILVNGAVRKGERLMPPSALDLLLRATFPPSSARVKATERFESVYPVLKEVALAGVPGSKAMKQVTQQTLTFAVKAAGEGIPELSREATDIFIWCLTRHPDSYKQWDNIYLDNLEASLLILKKLTEEWRQLSENQSSLEGLGETLKSLRHKNEKALADGAQGAHHSLLKDADKYCKWLIGKISRGNGCMKSLAIVIIALGVGTVVMSPTIESLDWKQLSVFFNQQSFLTW